MALPSSIMQEHLKQGKLSLVMLTLWTLRPLGLRKRSLDGGHASHLDAVRFKFAPPLELHQSVFKLLDFILPPKDHVPNNDRRRKVGDAALSRTPQRDEAHAEILGNRLLRDKVSGKLH
ncbi:MAG: hypothetical protein ABL956_19315 [Hyphomonadaceae bacterium]